MRHLKNLERAAAQNIQALGLLTIRRFSAGKERGALDALPPLEACGQTAWHAFKSCLLLPIGI